MPLTSLLQALGVWLLGVVSTGAVLGGIAAWVGKLVADRLSASTSARYSRELEQLRNQYSRDLEQLRSKYSTELEQLRSELASQRDTLRSAHGALASGYTGAYERVVTAIEFLWHNMMATREFVDQYIFFYQILLPSEYEDVSEERADKVASMVPEQLEEEFYEAVRRLRDGIAERRPFLGERLWWYQYIYFAFATRMAHKVWEERKQKRFFMWNKNSDGTPDQIQEMLSIVLSKAEQDVIIGPRTENPTVMDLGIPHRILAAIEGKILAEMNEWIFGKRLITMSIEQQQRVAEQLTQIGKS